MTPPKRVVSATPEEAVYRRLEQVRRWAERRLGRKVRLTELLNPALALFADRYCPAGRVRRREELLKLLSKEEPRDQSGFHNVHQGGGPRGR